MVTFTQEQANAHEARIAVKAKRLVPDDSPSLEAELHDKILSECRRRGWIALHSRMDMAATLTVGAPDFIVMADKGRTLYIECKRATGKISIKQAALHAQAKQLGHFVFTVRSLQQFLELIV